MAHAMPIRVLRPSLSLRWQVLRREASTSSAAAAAEPINTSRASFVSRHRTRIVLSSAAIVAGIISGTLVSHTLAPGSLPDASTPQDRILIADLNERIDNDFKIRVLRGKCLSVANQLKGQVGGWIELVKEETQSTHGLMSSLAGYKALGVERLFWNNKTDSLVAVVWFGASISGWPGITHGGVIATQLMNKIGLASTLIHGGYQNAAASSPQSLPGTGNHAKALMPNDQLQEPEKLSLSYVKPTYAEGLYVIRVSPVLGLANELADVVPMESFNSVHDYEATLETLDGKILVKAKAKMPANHAGVQVQQKAADAAVKTYEQFKHWMWPSRQSPSSSVSCE